MNRILTIHTTSTAKSTAADAYAVRHGVGPILATKRIRHSTLVGFSPARREASVVDELLAAMGLDHVRPRRSGPDSPFWEVAVPDDWRFAGFPDPEPAAPPEPEPVADEGSEDEVIAQKLRIVADRWIVAASPTETQSVLRRAAVRLEYHDSVDKVNDRMAGRLWAAEKRAAAACRKWLAQAETSPTMGLFCRALAAEFQYVATGEWPSDFKPPETASVETVPYVAAGGGEAGYDRVQEFLESHRENA